MSVSKTRTQRQIAPPQQRTVANGRWQGLLLLLLVLLAACTPPEDPPASNVNIPIAPEFQTFYSRYGGIATFGHPLAEEYPSPVDNRTVQYFQRMRLEYSPTGDEISVAQLGKEFIPENWVTADLSEDENGREFATGFTVQDEFLTFYETHHGERLFGQPISPQIEEGNIRAQYFENVRLEWHPGAPLEARIQIGLLGKAHYDRVGIFEFQATKGFLPIDPAAIREATVSATVSAPILYAGDDQVVFVQVSNPDGGQPVADAQVTLTVTYNGKTDSVPLTNTDETGHAQGALVLTDAAPGQTVQVQVTAFYNQTIIGTTSLSFKTWW